MQTVGVRASEVILCAPSNRKAEASGFNGAIELELLRYEGFHFQLIVIMPAGSFSSSVGLLISFHRIRHALPIILTYAASDKHSLHVVLLHWSPGATSRRFFHVDDAAS